MELSKRVSVFAVASFFVLSAGACFAQEQKAAPAAAPVAAPAAQSKTIFDYQKELSLSDKQVDSLKKLLADLQTKMGDFQQKIMTARQQLNDQVRTEAPMKEIRKQLEKISAVQIDATCTDFETARQVNAILTAEQIKKWKDIQEKFRQELRQNAAAAQPAQ